MTLLSVGYVSSYKPTSTRTSCPELGGTFHQLLTRVTMLDFASEQSSYEGISQMVRGLDRGIEEFLEILDQLPFELRNMDSFISATSEGHVGGLSECSLTQQISSRDCKPNSLTNVRPYLLFCFPRS